MQKEATRKIGALTECLALWGRITMEQGLSLSLLYHGQTDRKPEVFNQCSQILQFRLYSFVCLAFAVLYALIGCVSTFG